MICHPLHPIPQLASLTGTIPDEDAGDVLVLLEGLPERRVVSLPAGGGAEVGALPAEHLDHARQLPLHAQLKGSLAEGSPEKVKSLVCYKYRPWHYVYSMVVSKLSSEVPLAGRLYYSCSAAKAKS